MMLSRVIVDAINTQIAAELYSAYLYLSMSAWFESVHSRGAASWMLKQSEEEVTHAMKFFRYVTENGGTIELLPIGKPKMTWKSALDAFTDAYHHEVKVTGMIDGLVRLSKKEKDETTESFLDWYVSEQVEEEENASGFMKKFASAGDSIDKLMAVDKELGQRT